MPKSTLAPLLVALLAAGLPGVSEAATVTVSSVGELRTAVQNANDGDIIELTDGVYNWSDQTTLVTIQSKTNLTIRSQSGDRDAVVLQGQGINSGTQFCFKLYDSPNCTIQDMTLRDVYWHCVQVNQDSHYCTLKNLVMIDAGEGPVKVTSGGLSGYSDYGLVEDCHLEYTDRGMRSVVEGIDIVAAVGWVIRRCQFYNATKGTDPEQIGWGFFAKGNAQDSVVDRCYFEDCDIPISFGGGGTSPEWFRNGNQTCEHRRGIMKNNVANRTKDVAVYMNSATEFKLYNNTLWSTFPYADSSVDVRFNSSGEVYNNIGSQYYRLRDGGAATFSGNLWHAGSALFVDQPGGDFHLRSDATSAIDQGVDTSADVPVDMDGETRPAGTAVDIGADEYGASGPQPLALLDVHPNERAQGPGGGPGVGTAPWQPSGLGPGSLYKWKTYQFQGSDDLWIQVCAQSYSASQNAVGQADRLKMKVDGTVPLDVWGIMSGIPAYQWDGNADRGNRLMLEFQPPGLTTGLHTIEFWGDETPILWWVAVWDLAPQETE